MRNIAAVYYRELKSFFTSQIFYVISAVFIFAIGNMFKNVFFDFALRSMEILKLQWEQGPSNLIFINVNQVPIGTFGAMNFILLLIVPVLTMRLYAEEKKSGTIELLMTSPITTLQVLLGKYFSCLTIYSILVLLTSVFMVILTIQSQGLLDIRPVISAYLGSLMLGIGIIPIGIFCSSITENQIIASAVSLTIILGLWVLLFSAQFFAYPINNLIAYISITEHLESFTHGFIGVRHVVYYISLSIFWLFLTWMSVESTRWR